jgi:L-ascorbate metabolism protein UlaG (beta-lactamase superfamily)
MDRLLPDKLDLPEPRCSVTESTLAGTTAVVLDNGVFRLSVLPDFGGRLCSLFYRPLNLELLATEFIQGPRNALNVHGGWCAAFPSLLADGELISREAWAWEIQELEDARVTLRLHCLVDRISHKVEGMVRSTPSTVLVERFVRLRAGESAVEVEDVLTNRNIWPMPTTWSGMISLRARAGDRAVAPVESVEVQRGVGPSGNELDFGLLVSTPYQVFARDLREGWLGFRPSSAPLDIRLTFPRDLLPHAVIIGQRDPQRPAEDSFRFQPLATPNPVAGDTRGDALLLPPKSPVHLPVRLEVGTGIIGMGAWSRPGMQLADMIMAQRVPASRLAAWRVGEQAVVLKTNRHLLLLMPEYDEDGLFTPEDLPAADLILCADAPPRSVLRTYVQRTSARFIGPAELRQKLLTDGVGEDRSVALSPGARVDLAGISVLATPARTQSPDERLGYLLQADHLTLYHAGRTQYLGEFGILGQQFSPQLVFLPLAGMTLTDAVHAARQLQPRVVVPLGEPELERQFAQRCRDQHVAFSVHILAPAAGALFDGWHLRAMG